MRVYPRVRGGAKISDAPQLGEQGLSPRPRGSPTDAVQRDDVPGSIPASAGEPGMCPGRCAAARVYPRVRGGAFAAGKTPPFGWGLSPRPRGSPARRMLGPDTSGSIPASAGEPGCMASRRRWIRVYPRVRGGAISAHRHAGFVLGLSPRPRGSLNFSSPFVMVFGSIPASAGEPRTSIPWQAALWVYPRVRGGAGSCRGP